jgi:hypothetical protein
MCTKTKTETRAMSLVKRAYAVWTSTELLWMFLGAGIFSLLNDVPDGNWGCVALDASVIASVGLGFYL